MINAEQVEKYGIKTRGKALLIKHLEGSRLTQREAIVAKCYDCMGFYADGSSDCEIDTCPLYQYNPHGRAWREKLGSGD